MTNGKSSSLCFISQRPDRRHSQSLQPDNTGLLLHTQPALLQLGVACRQTNNYWRRSGKSFPALCRDTHRSQCRSNRRSKRRAGFLSLDRFDQALAISEFRIRIADWQFLRRLSKGESSRSPTKNCKSAIINPQAAMIKGGSSLPVLRTYQNLPRSGSPARPLIRAG